MPIPSTAKNSNARAVVALPPSPRVAHRLARKLRTDGFWSLPPRIWNGAADLAEVFAESNPTPAQLAWLWSAHEKFLEVIQ
jgi:hypothetical protein